jgi:hypothetical protein
MVLLLGVPYTTLTELIGTQPTHILLESSSQDKKNYAIQISCRRRIQSALQKVEYVAILFLVICLNSVLSKQRILWYIEAANYLVKREVSLMPRCLLCPGFNGTFFVEST